MINAKVNLSHVHVEASAKDDATLVAEAAVMFLGVARSIIENANDGGLTRSTLVRVVNDVAERIEEGKFDDDDEQEEETEEKAEDSELDKAINAIAEKVLQRLKKDGNA